MVCSLLNPRSRRVEVDTVSNALLAQSMCDRIEELRSSHPAHEKKEVNPAPANVTMPDRKGGVSESLSISAAPLVLKGVAAFAKFGLPKGSLAANWVGRERVSWSPKARSRGGQPNNASANGDGLHTESATANGFRARFASASFPGELHVAAPDVYGSRYARRAMSPPSVATRHSNEAELIGRAPRTKELRTQ